MSYLYINEHASEVSVKGGYFVVKKKSGEEYSIPKETLDNVAIFGNTLITPSAVKELLKRGIPVGWFSGRGEYFGRLDSTVHKNIQRLKKQIYLSDNEEFCTDFSKKILSAKISNQIIILKRYSKNSGVKVDEYVNSMKSAKFKISSSLSTEEIIGYEGRAAREYFTALSKLVKPDFSFKGRTRMPPTDPFNSMLSLGYTLLMHELYGEIESKGLTAYCGFLHKDRERHPTLASDLMEEWRAVIVDAVVLSLVQGNEISAEDFTKDEETGGVFLNDNAKKIFFNKYETKMRALNTYINGINMSYRRCLAYQANAITKMIEENDERYYEPIYIR